MRKVRLRLKAQPFLMLAMALQMILLGLDALVRFLSGERRNAGKKYCAWIVLWRGAFGSEWNSCTKCEQACKPGWIKQAEWLFTCGDCTAGNNNLFVGAGG